jgi:hypothetical protein
VLRGEELLARFFDSQEKAAHPALTLFKIAIMTVVLLAAGVAIYRSSPRVQRPDIAGR